MKIFSILMLIVIGIEESLANSFKELEYDDELLMSTANNYVEGKILDVISIKRGREGCFTGLVKFEIENSVSDKNNKGDIISLGITRNIPLPIVGYKYGFLLYKIPKNFYSRCKINNKIKGYDFASLDLVHGARYVKLDDSQELKRFEYSTCESTAMNFLFESKLINKQITNFKKGNKKCKKLIGKYDEFKKLISENLKIERKKE